MHGSADTSAIGASVRTETAVTVCANEGKDWRKIPDVLGRKSAIFSALKDARE